MEDDVDKLMAMMIFGVLASSSAYAQTGGFKLYGDTPQISYYLSVDTYEYSRAPDGAPTFGAIVKAYEKSSTQSTFYKEYVSADCIKGYGKLYIYGIDGVYFKYVDWVKGSGTVASDLAEILCAVSMANSKK